MSSSMDNTASQWLPQGFNGVVMNKPQLESSSSKAAEINNNSQLQLQVEKREIRAKKEQPLNCPRCNSLNTKFCYYNNYSLSQPRHYCKTCKRYWTQGGSLRNIPVGGASRKNRRSSSSSSSSSSTSSSKQIIPPSSNSNLFIHGGTVDQSQNPSSYLNLPMISSGYSTDNMMMINSVFSIQEPKPTMNYFAEIDQNGVHLHRQAMAATAKFDGLLFDQIGRGEGDHHRSIGFGLNNGMFGGGSPWQL